MQKYSRQREGILLDLQSRYDHPTADMIYDSVRVNYPNISLGTVYRNLALLAENGQILKIVTGIGPDRFDAHTKPHSHFICRYCGDVIDLDHVSGERTAAEALAIFDGEVEEVILQFYGKCGKCLSKAKHTS